MAYNCEQEIRRLKKELSGKVQCIAERDKRMTDIINWLEENQPDVFKRGIWDALQEQP